MFLELVLSSILLKLFVDVLTRNVVIGKIETLGAHRVAAELYRVSVICEVHQNAQLVLQNCMSLTPVNIPMA